jgi:phosphonate metabolism protein PhnN/1,5-bisphosphokinase (PRPP-forming)
VGPSGAGKDAIIGVVRERLAQDPRFLFLSRIVTREPSAAERHHTVTADEFEVLVQRGALALHWHAHGLRYGLPAAMDAAVQRGCTVIFNASRQVIPAAKSRYACAVVYIDVPLHVRAQRLATRSREHADDIAARLERVVAGFNPCEADLVIDNSGSLAAAAERLARWLLAASPAPPRPA